MGNVAETYFEQAMLALTRREHDRVDRLLVECLKADPKFIEAWVLRGNSLNVLGRPFDAVLNYERALQLEPNRRDALTNVGIALADLGKFEAAEEAYKRSIRVLDAVEPRMNLADLCVAMMRLEEGVEHYRRATEHEPGNHEAHLNLGVALMGLGKWDEGFREYYWRHKGTPYPEVERTRIPLWEGQSLRGKHILLMPEQGFGDEILFMRVVQWLQHRVPQTTYLKARSPMRLLAKYSFSSLWNYANVVIVEPGDIVPADYVCSLMDVAMWLKVQPTEEVVPVTGAIYIRWPESHPYVPKDGFRIGLCWESGQRPLQPDTKASAANKSIPLEMFSELIKSVDHDRVRFISLQKDHRDQKLARELGIIDFMEGVNDFAGTAAIINKLDLVISVDTAVAHLAAAMGAPTMNLVRFSGYWPWMGATEDTIWYPGMRIYRQPKLWDWKEPLNRLQTDVAGIVQKYVEVNRAEEYQATLPKIASTKH